MIDRTLLMAATAICLLGTNLTAGDWPRFRGPTADGHWERDLPTQWSSSRNVVWKRRIEGKGWSSPAIVNGRIYLTTAVAQSGSNGGDLSLRLVVLDQAGGGLLRDGEVFRLPSSEVPRIHEKNSHASPTPIVDGPKVYLHFGHHGTACLDLQGEVLWRNKQHPYQPVHGNGGSPILVEDVLIFSCDGAERSFVVGLDKDSGEQRWIHHRTTDASKTFSFSTPTLISVAGRAQVISPGSNTVDALDPASGEVLWRVRYDGYSLIPKPVFGHGLVYVASGYDRPELLAIRPDGAGDVTGSHVAWRFDRNVPHTASLLLVAEELYMVSDKGVATCLDAKSGRPHWRSRLSGTYSASPIYASGKIYFQSEDGETSVLKSGRRFQKLATNSIGERTLASFAAAGNRLYIRGEQHLFCIGEHDRQDGP